MAVVIQELVIQSKIVNDSIDNNNAAIENLARQIQSLKMQIKNLKEKVEYKQNEDTR